MKTADFLRQATAIPGVTGNEGAVAAFIADAFRPFVDEVEITPLNCVIAHKKGNGPKVLICAHLDEIGMMVSKIEEDGSLRLQSVGGVDPRVLPGMRVRVFTKDGELMGVVGATPPHLLKDADKKNNYNWETLFVDMGMSAEKVREKVKVGDTVCFEARYVELKNGRVATKTADDRACVAIMLEAAQRLCEMKYEADLYFVATCQEEIGSYGAATAGFGVDPEIAIALDVCHANTPGAPALRTHELNNVVATKGPFINRYLRKKLDEIAREINVEVQVGVAARNTATDADSLTIVRGGVPTVLLELPLKYMHTSVETFDMHAVTECARLLTAYCSAIDDTWRDELWT